MSEERVFTSMSSAELREAVTELAKLEPDEFAAMARAAQDESEEPFCIECGWLWPDGQERCGGCGW